MHGELNWKLGCGQGKKLVIRLLITLRELGMVLLIDEEVRVKKVSNIAYQMDRMKMSSKKR